MQKLQALTNRINTRMNVHLENARMKAYDAAKEIERAMDNVTCSSVTFVNCRDNARSKLEDAVSLCYSAQQLEHVAQIVLNSFSQIRDDATDADLDQLIQQILTNGKVTIPMVMMKKSEAI